MTHGSRARRLCHLKRSINSPAAFDGVTLTFKVEAGKTMGFELKQGPNTMQHNRVEETNHESQDPGITTLRSE